MATTRLKIAVPVGTQGTKVVPDLIEKERVIAAIEDVCPLDEMSEEKRKRWHELWDQFGPDWVQEVLRLHVELTKMAIKNEIDAM